MVATAVVQFCGLGGTSEGARQAGIHVVAAINHSRIAIASHAENHPACQHFQQAMEEITPDATPDADYLLTSPCCTNHAKAKGQKHYHQFDLFGDIVFDPLAERSRNTMDDVVRFAAAKKRDGHPYKYIVVENVIDVLAWRKYQEWLTSLTVLGYRHQALYWNSQFCGVPQSRDRVYIVFWLQDLPSPDFDFRPRAWCKQCNREVNSVQSWKQGAHSGVYQDQYTYNCPGCTKIIAPYAPSIRSVLSDDIGTTLKDRPRPLCTATIDKVCKGIQRMHGDPFMLGYYGNPVYRRLGEPVGTITTVDRWALVTPASHFEETRFRMLSIDEAKAAMGFSEEYRILGTAKEQMWQLGNAVCPPVMATILQRCQASLGEQRIVENVA